MPATAFQSGYREQLEKLLKQHNLDGTVQFVGQLKTSSPGPVLCPASRRCFPFHSPGSLWNCGRGNDGLRTSRRNSGVGGAGELIDDGRTGLHFIAGDSKDLARCLKRLVDDGPLLNRLRQSGQQEARQRFSVMAAATALEAGFRETSAVSHKNKTVF